MAILINLDSSSDNRQEQKLIQTDTGSHKAISGK